MTQQEIDKLKQKGFDIEKLNKLVSLQFLLSTIIETQVLETQEYLKEFNLSLKYVNDIQTIKRNISFFKAKIKPQLLNDKINDYFDDYESLTKIINKWAKIDE